MCRSAPRSIFSRKSMDPSTLSFKLLQLIYAASRVMPHRDGCRRRRRWSGAYHRVPRVSQSKLMEAAKIQGSHHQ
jgi:hypothetical protein